MPLNPVLFGKVLGFLLVLSAIISVAVRQPNNFRLVLSHLSLGLMALFNLNGSGRIKLFSFVLSILTNAIALLLLIFIQRDDEDLLGLPKGGKPTMRDQLFHGGMTLSTIFAALISTTDNVKYQGVFGLFAFISYGVGLLMYLI